MSQANDISEHRVVHKGEEWLRYWALVRYKVYANLRTEAARTYAGFLWWILDPLMSMIIYYLVFGLLFKRQIENFVQFLLIGIVLWRWFQTTVMSGAQSILKAKGLVRQVYLPKMVFPVVSMFVDTFKFLIIFSILMAFVFMTGFNSGIKLIALPLLLTTQALFITGITLVLASIIPFVPDIRMVLDSFMRLWFFMSGIFYDIRAFSDEAQALFRLNPMLLLIDWNRELLLYNRWPPFAEIGLIAGLSLILILLGSALISRHDYDYPKIAF